jgi:precorrin-6Y C5,15-methyltransferase (decarboxylating)
MRAPLSAWLERLESLSRDTPTVVLVSGDSGFFSLAGVLVKRLGLDRLSIHPNISSLQAAFARLGKPWQDAALLSLHSRGFAPLWSALRSHELVGLLTGPERGPAQIAQMLIQRDQDNWRIWVFENLGNEKEAYAPYTLNEASNREFAELNVVILERLSPPRLIKPGAPEEAYSHQAGLITKAEVRAAALAYLDLEPGQVLWDLGAGSGSVGLEACLFLETGKVIAVEKNPERIADIRKNRRRFAAGNLEITAGKLPEALAGLPAPDRVFIGGSGDDLAATIQGCIDKLAYGGRMVASVVKLESLAVARESMTSGGLEVGTVQLQINRGKSLTGGNTSKP